MVRSELSKISSTVACDTGLRADEPEKITSVSESPRRRLAALSPMTQRIASMMLDLPQPFGPTTPVMLVGRCSVVGSTKDLKPESLIVDRRMRRRRPRDKGEVYRGFANVPGHPCRRSTPMADPVLLADIGGTNARFALADPGAGMPLLEDSIRGFPVGAFGSLAEAGRHYLDALGARPSRAVFAVAGRVEGDLARMTNHPWVVSRRRAMESLGLESVELVNDFVAQAMAVGLL